MVASISKYRTALLVGGGTLAGVILSLAIYGAIQWGGQQGGGASESAGRQLPAELLHATGSSANDAFAVATGPIEDGEGLFMLDFLTGELQCYVINPRTRTFSGLFKANVAQQLGVDQSKKPRYLMVTGQTTFQRGAGGARLANCVCYVVDANTGNFAAYTLPWNSTLAASGRPQGGAMVVLDAGKARNIDVGE